MATYIEASNKFDHVQNVPVRVEREFDPTDCDKRLQILITGRLQLAENNINSSSITSKNQYGLATPCPFF